MSASAGRCVSGRCSVEILSSGVDFQLCRVVFFSFFESKGKKRKKIRNEKSVYLAYFCINKEHNVLHIKLEAWYTLNIRALQLNTFKLKIFYNK